MDVFKRRMEDTPVGFVATGSSGRTAMTGTNKVSYDLIRPASDSEPYKAVVTVASQSHYSILRTAEPPKEDSRDKTAKDKSTGILDESDPDAASFDNGDPTSIDQDSGNQSNSATSPGEDRVARRESKPEVRKYELIYQNGRWNLVTKLDEKTEKAVENAFNNALGIQI
jgi:hypothetical protein